MNEGAYRMLAQCQTKALRQRAQEAVETNAELRSLRRQVKALDKEIAELRRALEAERRVNKLTATLQFSPRQKTRTLRVFQAAERAAQKLRKIA